MLGEKFEKEILKKIKDKDPVPKWHFLFKDYIVWSLGVLSLLVGGLAFSVVIYLISGNGQVYNNIDFSFFEIILLFMPYFWLLIIVLFVVLFYFYIKHTKKGYKYSVFLIICLSISLSVFIGVLGYRLGLGQLIDDTLGEKAPTYYEIFNPHMRMWKNPESGRISGMIIFIDEDSFGLIDLAKKEWRVFTENKITFPINNGCPIKIIGEQISNNEFKAFEILPPGPGRRFIRNVYPLKDKHEHACGSFRH